MHSFLRAYRWLNLLSLDVAAGAVCSAIFFATIAPINIRPVGMMCLGLVVWIIYTADHLMDAFRLKGTATTARHRYHQKHFWGVMAAVCLAMVMVGVLLFFIRPEVFFGGSILLVLVIVYLLVNQYLHYLKEVLVAFIYVLGVLLPTLARMEDPLQLMVREEVICFYLLALLNLLIFSCYEMEADRHESQPSFAVYFGVTFTKRVILLLFVMLGLFSSIILFLHPLRGLILSLMGGLLSLIFFLPQKFKTEERYRLLGDAVFLLPLAVLLK